MITIDGSIIEMRAIANVIGDTDLQKLVELLSASVPQLDVGESREEWIGVGVLRFGNTVTEVQEKTYKLLSDVTESAG